MIILGIDPGISGALAWLDGDELIATADMPITCKAVGKGNQTDANMLAYLIELRRPIRAVIEAVGPMPGQGVTSVFSFGRSAGVIEGVLAALEIPYSLVHPQRWKKRAGLLKADKGRSRTIAMATWPACAEVFHRVKDNGRAEAALIAKFGGE